jgi:hypothetical protein
MADLIVGTKSIVLRTAERNYAFLKEVAKSEGVSVPALIKRLVNEAYGARVHAGKAAPVPWRDR